MASLFYNVGPLSQIALNLFEGWGYNFYRIENQLRADDQVIRGKACFLLGTAATQVRDAEDSYRREHLPAPTRARPYPDPVAVSGAQKLERFAASLISLSAIIQGQPVPENDRMTERYRQEGPTLYALAQADQLLIGQCDLMRTLTENKAGSQLLAEATELEEGLTAIQATLQQRAAVLHTHHP